MNKAEKTLSNQVQRIVLQQGLRYLPSAMDNLGMILQFDSGATGSVRVQAARALIAAMTMAGSEMTETEAGSELLEAVREAEHVSSIETEIPDGIKESFDD